MIYIITVKLGYFFDGLGSLCWDLKLIKRIIINLIENTYKKSFLILSKIFSFIYKKFFELIFKTNWSDIFENMIVFTRFYSWSIKIKRVFNTNLFHT